MSPKSTWKPYNSQPPLMGVFVKWAIVAETAKPYNSQTALCAVHGRCLAYCFVWTCKSLQFPTCPCGDVGGWTRRAVGDETGKPYNSQTVHECSPCVLLDLRFIWLIKTLQFPNTPLFDTLTRAPVCHGTLANVVKANTHNAFCTLLCQIVRTG